MKKTSFKDKNEKELAKLHADKVKALNEFRFNLSTGRAKNTKEGRTLKKDIARLLTVMNANKKAATAEAK